MMSLHAAARAAAPGHLVLYRVGEFYEVLGPDAAIVSRTLGIQLTRRRQKDAADIPMCGVPASTLETATARLLAAGHKVALSEQATEDGGDRPLRRLTPSTSVDAAVLAADRANNLTVAFAEGVAVAFAWIDLSTGEAGTCMAALEGCGPALARIAPSEVLVAQWPDGSDALAVALRGAGGSFSDLNRAELSSEDAQALLTQAYGPEAGAALRGFSPPELRALTLLLDYVRATVGVLPEALLLPRRAPIGGTMEIDAPTLRGLEVLSAASGRDGALLSVLDRTVTPPGARLLARQLRAPLTNPETIHRRLAMVRYLVDTPPLRAGCRERLSSMPDMLRACGRLSLGKAGPRDLAAVRDGLARAREIVSLLNDTPNLPAGLATTCRELGLADEDSRDGLAGTLRRALVSVPPMMTRELGFIAEGYDRQLETGRAAASAARNAIARLPGPLHSGDRGVSRNWWDHAAILTVTSGRPMGSNR
jgi:DNA mismatch repair protein MutS